MNQKERKFEHSKVQQRSLFFSVYKKSHLINLNNLKEYLNTNGGEVVMKDGSSVPVFRCSSVPVERNRLPDFLQRIKG